MKVFYSIIGILLALIFVFQIYAMGLNHRLLQEEMQQRKLARSIDIAMDDTISTVVENDGNITKPKYALDMFVSSMLVSYDVPTTKEEQEDFKNSFLPVFVVVSNDGYFLGSHTAPVLQNETDKVNEEPLRFEPKKPFAIVNGGKTYAMKLDGTCDYAIDNATGNLENVDDAPAGITRSMVIAKANSEITEAIARTLKNDLNASKTWSGTFYLPNELATVRKTNAIKSPTVIAIVDGINYGSIVPVTNFSVAGSRVLKTRSVVGYTRAGIRYYAYADRVPDTVVVDDFYTTPEQAAIDERSCDLTYMD